MPSPSSTLIISSSSTTPMDPIPETKSYAWTQPGWRGLPVGGKLFAVEERSSRFYSPRNPQKTWWATWSCCEGLLKSRLSACVAKIVVIKFDALRNPDPSGESAPANAAVVRVHIELQHGAETVKCRSR